jgi:hypothetical protein
LNSGVNDRRGRGLLFATVSILDILSGVSPHLVDVRQTVLTPGNYEGPLWFSWMFYVNLATIHLVTRIQARAAQQS